MSAHGRLAFCFVLKGEGFHDLSKWEGIESSPKNNSDITNNIHRAGAYVPQCTVLSAVEFRRPDWNLHGNTELKF